VKRKTWWPEINGYKRFFQKSRNALPRMRLMWEKMRVWHNQNFVSLLPGVTKRRIREVEEKVKFRFPPYFVASLMVHNGQSVVRDVLFYYFIFFFFLKDCVRGVLVGSRLMSLDEILRFLEKNEGKKLVPISKYGQYFAFFICRALFSFFVFYLGF